MVQLSLCLQHVPRSLGRKHSLVVGSPSSSKYVLGIVVLGSKPPVRVPERNICLTTLPAAQMAGGHALEFLKIDKQVSNDSYRAIIRKMTANKGLAGALDGFFPWGCLQSAVKVPT